MKYTVYKTTNTANDKIYLGVHKTEQINDSYLGSGMLLLKAVKKYGKDRFVKQILFVYSTAEEALEKEREIVDEEFVSRTDTYNICIGGGAGGKGYNGLSFKGRKHTKESIEQMLENKPPHKLSVTGRDNLIEHNKTNEERKRKISNTLSGRPKTEEHKQKISESMLSSDKRGRKGINKGTKPNVECPYCDKQGSANNMSRWHFDNCPALINKKF